MNLLPAEKAVVASVQKLAQAQIEHRYMTRQEAGIGWLSWVFQFRSVLKTLAVQQEPILPPLALADLWNKIRQPRDNSADVIDANTLRIGAFLLYQHHYSSPASPASTSFGNDLSFISAISDGANPMRCVTDNFSRTFISATPIKFAKIPRKVEMTKVRLSMAVIGPILRQKEAGGLHKEARKEVTFLIPAMSEKWCLLHDRDAIVAQGKSI